MRVHVRGAGIVGLACADLLLSRGHDVAVVDRAPGSGASAVAAGMLSPAGEVWHGDADLHRLGVESARMWPAYAAGLGVRLHQHGTLLVGHDAGDRQRLEQQVALLATLDRPVDLLTPAQARRLEPGLGRVLAAVRVDDAAVDPRSVVAALLHRLAGRVHDREPPQEPDAVVVATGARLPAAWSPLVHAVRGEVVRLRMGEAPLHVVRGWVAGDPVYVVPRSSGEVVVGATAEEHDGPPRVTAGGVLRLLRAARTLLPAVDRAEVLGCAAGDRPATRDHLPLIGPTHDPRTWLAAGHFRHGVLLAPLTARLLADALEGAPPDPAVDPRRLLTHPGGPTCA